MAKVLLVEDDFSLRDVYSARFAAEGYTVVTASDGEEALAAAVREHPDLIVLDVMMPKISGFDVLDILRSTPDTKSTKVIMMTALSQDADRQRGEALGVDKYLVKSQVTLEDVAIAVKQTLSGAPNGGGNPAPTATPPPTP
jgi:two-component system phosphate regulon response regulator PhoB